MHERVTAVNLSFCHFVIQHGISKMTDFPRKVKSVLLDFLIFFSKKLSSQTVAHTAMPSLTAHATYNSAWVIQLVLLASQVLDMAR